MALYLVALIMLCIGTFLGFFTGFLLHYWIVLKRQFDGNLYVTKEDDGIQYFLELSTHPFDLLDKPVAVFKLVKHDPPPRT